MPMEIVLQRLDKGAVIKVSDRLDIYTSPGLRKAAFTFLSKGRCKNLTVDFTGVSFIDTSGLATLLEILMTSMEQGTELILRGINEKARYLIDINGLTGFFTIRPSTEERSTA